MRIDSELVVRHIYPTRAKAVAAIKSGIVFINGATCFKSSTDVKISDVLTASPLPYMSGRGSLKLAHALDFFNINPAHLTCLDVGASTGGFTEILLARGAAKIFAVDVGTAQLIPELKNNPRVVSLENTDIRALAPISPIDLVVIDVSFISLCEILPAVLKWNPKIIIPLIKPQFEVNSAVAAKNKGIIKSEIIRQECIKNVLEKFAGYGLKNLGVIESPIKGGSGNTEYLTACIL